MKTGRFDSLIPIIALAVLLAASAFFAPSGVPKQAVTGGSIPVAGVAIVNGEYMIDINAAPADLLMSLDGIGETRAAKIIEYRETNGGFKSVDELAEVEGIGESILNDIRARVIVR